MTRVPEGESDPYRQGYPIGKRCLIALLVGWVAAVVVGFAVLIDYQQAPGAPAVAPTRWPAATQIPRAASGGTLVLFVHPQCSCTRATMAELGRLVRTVRGRVAIHAVFVQPREYDRAWVEAELWHQARVIPGVVPHHDPNGVEARRFGAFTSGQVLYYDALGRLRFAGGITSARSHEGDNKGRAALADWITTGQSDRSSTFVFGCALRASKLNPWKRLEFSFWSLDTAHAPSDR